ncbi:long-chain fatty acid--CoA ligase [candidate division KSB1 bacterium 4484_87]|nr:MAG: long-chain fatty acid--CoA ligase [candidate division KSB1 bacterium 4484_87]
MIQLEQMTLACLLKQSIENFAEHPALGFVDEQPITYQEMSVKIKQLIALLHEFHIEKGDKVAILGENSPHWGIAYLAITSMGAIVVPILPNFHPSEIHHILRGSGSKVLFCSEKLAQKVDETSIDRLNTVISLDDFSVREVNQQFAFLKDLIKKGLEDISRLGKAARQVIQPCEVDIDEDDLAAIIYTSGTTGHSKGVMLTHKNIVSNVLAIGKLVMLSPGDRLISLLPLSHTMECTVGFLTQIAHGCMIYYLRQAPTARTLLPALEKVSPTIMVSVPLIMEKIYKNQILRQINSKLLTRLLYRTGFGRKLLNKVAGKKLYRTFGGKLRHLVFGGAPLGAEVENFLREGNFPYACGYGLTETSPLLTGTLENVKFQSAGPAIPEVEIKIVDPDPESGIGEIYAKGPNVMKGYFNDPERSAEVLSPEGWFKTGDRGFLDQDGYLFIKGRSKNMLLGPSGENIYPEEIEQHLNESEFVLESLVYQKDRRIIARVHLDYDLLDRQFRAEKLTESEIRKRIDKLLIEIKKEVNSKVSDFSKIHEVIEQTEPFEKTPTLKIKRYLYTEGER